MEQGEFRHPRLVEVYDAGYGWGPEDDRFVALVGGRPCRVLDLGCGTGRLALGLAALGHAVTGVDPAAASLAAARAKAGSDAVTWIEGTSSSIPAGASFDVAVLTSHVGQFVVDDDAWGSVLGDLGRALVPGGRLVFDSCDPADRRWERWNPVESRRRIDLGDDGRWVDTWVEVTAVDDGVVAFTHTYRFDDGAELTGESRMRFRSESELRSSVTAAGFVVDRVEGGWHGEAVGEGDAGELLVVAHRASA